MAVETRSSFGILNPRRVFYGWWIVLSGFLLMLFSTGVGFYGFSAFVNPIADSIAGGSRAIVATAVSIQRAESGILGPIMGFLVDRIGPRKILVAGFIIGGIGFILVSLTQNVVQFYAAYMLLALGLGAGSFPDSSARRLRIGSAACVAARSDSCSSGRALPVSLCTELSY